MLLLLAIGGRVCATSAGLSTVTGLTLRLNSAIQNPYPIIPPATRAKNGALRIVMIYRYKKDTCRPPVNLARLRHPQQVVHVRGLPLKRCSVRAAI